jgi:hypothetical protein
LPRSRASEPAFHRADVLLGLLTLLCLLPFSRGFFCRL